MKVFIIQYIFSKIRNEIAKVISFLYTYSHFLCHLLSDISQFPYNRNRHFLNALNDNRPIGGPEIEALFYDWRDDVSENGVDGLRQEVEGGAQSGGEVVEGAHGESTAEVSRKINIISKSNCWKLVIFIV